MTYLEKLAIDHPEWDECRRRAVIDGRCPSDFDYECEPEDDCPGGVAGDCVACWCRVIPDTAAAARPVEASHGDPVAHPAHYTAGGVECIAAIEAALASQTDPVSAFLTGQVIKYLWRWPLKGGVEDIKKALWYLTRLKEREARHDV